MAQQTAVEYLLEKLYTEYRFEFSGTIVEQAKQMEKEQIQKAFSKGQETPINHPTLPHYSGEEYYNETYNK